MSFEVFDNRPINELTPRITLDIYGRFYLTVSALNLFDVQKGTPINLYIGYDSVNRRIGLARTDIVKLIDTHPIYFNKRSYASCKGFLNNYRIPFGKEKTYYIYVGRDDIGWHLFELENYSAPDAKGQEEKIRERKRKK